MKTKTTKKHSTLKAPTWTKPLARWFAGSPMPELFWLCILCVGKYLKNSDFSYPSELTLMLVLLAVPTVVLFYVIKLAMKRFGLLAVHIVGLFVTYTLYGYAYMVPSFRNLVMRLIPSSATDFTKAAVYLVLCMVLFSMFAYGVQWLLKRSAPKAESQILKILLFVITFVFVTQTFLFLANIWRYRHEFAYRPPANTFKQDASKITSKPNIYYLVFDRYASADTLQREYKYDNSKALDYLAGKGFVTREAPYANYPFTMMSISSTLRMGYHADLGAEFGKSSQNFQAAFPYRQFLSNPPVARELQKNGYSYNVVSSWWDFTRNSTLADTEPVDSFRFQIFGRSYWLTDLQRSIFGSSILKPLLQKGITVGHTTLFKYDKDRWPAQNFTDELSALKTIAAASATQKQPQFTFGHILSPHDPYIFNADGSYTTYDTNRTDNGADEYVKYTNQLTYANTQLMATVGYIREHDPTAVIIIQSDEGPYPKQFQGGQSPIDLHDPLKLPLTNLRQKYGILASYYLPGVDETTVRHNMDSSVNAFRFILSHYLGYDLPNLPDCQFSVSPKYNLFDYTEVTGKLRGTNNPAACAEYL